MENLKYKDIAKTLNSEGGAFADDEYQQLAAQDEIEARYFGGQEVQHG